jgi:hypothetical protein
MQVELAILNHKMKDSNAIDFMILHLKENIQMQIWLVVSHHEKKKTQMQIELVISHSTFHERMYTHIIMSNLKKT